MSLIKSPVRSAALLARCRANAQRSTGPRTSEGKARSCLNALRHGRRSCTLSRVLPRGLCLEDRLFYNWVHRAIRNSFPPQTPLHEGKVRRTVLQVWLQAKLEREGKNDDRTMYVAERRTFAKNRKPRNCFELQRSTPRGLLTFRTIEWGRNPRRRVTPPEVARASCPPAQTEERNAGWKPVLPEVARASCPPDAGWKPVLPEVARASCPPKPALPEPRRARTLLAVWRGESKVQDWQHEPFPEGELDAMARYHWKRQNDRRWRANMRRLASSRRQVRTAVWDLMDAVRELEEASRAGPPTSSDSPWGRLELSAGSLPATAQLQSPSPVGS